MFFTLIGLKPVRFFAGFIFCSSCLYIGISECRWTERVMNRREDKKEIEKQGHPKLRLKGY